MLKKFLTTVLIAFLLIPTLAGAANMQVNSSAVPVSGGTITPNGIKFSANDITYTVAPKAGWTLASVMIDGVAATGGQIVDATHFKVAYNTSKVHTIKANFTQASYLITTTAGTGGAIQVTGGGSTVSAGATRGFVVTPNNGYTIASITVNGTPVVPADPIVAYSSSLTNIQAAQTVAATFSAIPVVIPPFPGQNQTIGSTAGVFSTNLVGSASVSLTTIQWNLVSGPAGSAFGSPNALSTTFKGTANGVYVVNLTVNGVTCPNITVTVVDNRIQVCAGCHAGSVVTNFNASGHKTNAHGPQTCTACHVACDTLHPGTPTGCAGCHGATVIHPVASSGCDICHTTTAANPDAHAKEDGCIDCHAVQRDAGSGFVQDNSGVRAILGEFTKRSHHITGATPTNAQCIVCHLEGKGTPYGVHTDATYHMKDNKIYLRDADTNLPIVWSGTEHTNMDNFCFSCHDSNGAAGLATSGITVVPGFTGTAMNPFGDTLTNGYDQVARAGIVDVKTAFTTTNASHHAVSGQRYQYRFSTLANAQAWAARTGNPVPDASEISEGHVVINEFGVPVTSPFGSGILFDPIGPEEGGESTLYEADKFVSTYIPLGATQNVGDNSTLHCGDCHTVGQWKVGSSTNADGSHTSVAIGAHGSNNEYLLRNSLGTDAIHNSLTYVCFNCHKTEIVASTPDLWAELVAEGKLLPSNNAIPNGAVSAVKFVGTYTNSNGVNPVSVPVTYNGSLVPSWKAGWGSLHPVVFMGQISGYAVAHAVSAMHGQCLADSADNIQSVPNRGFNNFSSNRLQRSWAPNAVKVYDFKPAPGATAAAPLGGGNAGSGNITGIACTSCHNSGLRSGFGGIHGGNNTYTDGLGRTQKSYRFMPGMNNYRYAPPGGWDGKDVSDPTLLTANNPVLYGGPAGGSSAGYPGPDGKPMGGCYTNGGSGAAGSDLNNSGGVTYGVCNHHGTSTAHPISGPVPAVKPTTSGGTATFRVTYGGGTTGGPTAYEPTVREATAGGALVTRPLKY